MSESQSEYGEAPSDSEAGVAHESNTATEERRAIRLLPINTDLSFLESP
jgi:hypothetical protein